MDPDCLNLPHTGGNGGIGGLLLLLAFIAVLAGATLYTKKNRLRLFSAIAIAFALACSSQSLTNQANAAPAKDGICNTNASKTPEKPLLGSISGEIFLEWNVWGTTNNGVKELDDVPNGSIPYPSNGLVKVTATNKTTGASKTVDVIDGKFSITDLEPGEYHVETLEELIQPKATTGATFLLTSDKSIDKTLYGQKYPASYFDGTDKLSINDLKEYFEAEITWSDKTTTTMSPAWSQKTNHVPDGLYVEIYVHHHISDKTPISYILRNKITGSVIYEGIPTYDKDPFYMTSNYFDPIKPTSASDIYNRLPGDFTVVAGKNTPHADAGFHLIGAL